MLKGITGPTALEGGPDRLISIVERGLDGFEHSGSKALQTRARPIRERIGGSARA